MLSNYGVCSRASLEAEKSLMSIVLCWVINVFYISYLEVNNQSEKITMILNASQMHCPNGSKICVIWSMHLWRCMKYVAYLKVKAAGENLNSMNHPVSYIHMNLSSLGNYFLARPVGLSTQVKYILNISTTTSVALGRKLDLPLMFDRIAVLGRTIYNRLETS